MDMELMDSHRLSLRDVIDDKVKKFSVKLCDLVNWGKIYIDRFIWPLDGS